jgi:hypothetical protein
LIVVELDVFVHERSELVEVAVVVGIEQGSIERGDGAFEFCLVLNLVQRRHILCPGIADKYQSDCQDKKDRRQSSSSIHEDLAFEEIVTQE